MRRLSPLVLTCALLAAPTARAAALRVEVQTARGAPVADAVIEVTPAGRSLSALQHVEPLVIDQRGMQFHPFVLVAPVGASVLFSNRDKVRHHVYSFSPAKKFELKLYGAGETRSVVFDKPGVVALGCNIHDNMVAFVRVTNAPFAAKTDASGAAVLSNLPAGPATVRIWHPYMKGPEVVRTASVAAAGAAPLEVRLDLRPPPQSTMSPY